MAENDDYIIDSIDNNHLDGTNGSLNMTDNSLGVSVMVIRWIRYVPFETVYQFKNTFSYK